MKKILLLTLGLMFSANVFSKDLAQFRFAMRSSDGAQVSTFHHMVATISDEAVLSVEINSSTGNFPFFLPEDGTIQRTFSKTLNKHVFNLIKDDIIRLSQAEIEKRTNQIVCMMMPGPTMSNNHLSVLRGYDWNTQVFTGKMELVDGPKGCWVRNSTYPKNEYDRATATNLKALIRALTLDNFGEELE